MKKVILGIVIGVLSSITFSSYALSPSPKPTVTITATPTKSDPAQHLRRYCYGDDMVYIVDNSEWYGEPSQIAVSPNARACKNYTGDGADLKELKTNG
jgi:hypothetical protein